MEERILMEQLRLDLAALRGRMDQIATDVLVMRERSDARELYLDGRIDARIDARLDARLASMDQRRDRSGDSMRGWLAVAITTIGVLITLIVVIAQAQTGG